MEISTITINNIICFDDYDNVIIKCSELFAWCLEKSKKKTHCTFTLFARRYRKSFKKLFDSVFLCTLYLVSRKREKYCFL